MKQDNILGCKFIQRDKSQKITYDSVFLANFVKVKNNIKLIELGSGNGVVLILLKKLNINFNFDCTGIEIQSKLYKDAQINAKLNSMDIAFYNYDLRQIPKNFYGKYDIVVSNPPYMKVNNGKISPYINRDIARREINGGIKDFIKTASLLLKNRGKFYLIWRSERLEEAVIYLHEHKFALKILRPIYSNNFTDSYAILMMAMKNTNFGLSLQKPLYIRRRNEISSEVKKIYSIDR